MNYLEIDEVMAIHEKVLAVSGGREGVLDFTLLHSAVERSRATFGGEDLYPTLFEKGAALIHSLIQNHPFGDGNKRTAFVSTARFFHINAYQLVFTQRSAIIFVKRIQDKKTDVAKIATWLKAHTHKKKTLNARR